MARQRGAHGFTDLSAVEVAVNGVGPAPLSTARSCGLRPSGPVKRSASDFDRATTSSASATFTQRRAEPGQAPVRIGDAVSLLLDADGGRVFVHGVLSYAWDLGDDAGRILAAVQLVRTKAATALDVAAGFEMGRETLRRWINRAAESGVAGVVPAKRGPKGPSKVTPQMAEEIRAARAQGATLAVVADQFSVSVASVRRAEQAGAATSEPEPTDPEPTEPEPTEPEPTVLEAAVPEQPTALDPADPHLPGLEALGYHVTLEPPPNLAPPAHPVPAPPGADARLAGSIFGSVVVSQKACGELDGLFVVEPNGPLDPFDEQSERVVVALVGTLAGFEEPPFPGECAPKYVVCFGASRGTT